MGREAELAAIAAAWAAAGTHSPLAMVRLRCQPSTSSAIIVAGSGAATAPWTRVPRVETGPGHLRIRDMVEKPKQGTAPSRWAIVGRYVFPPSIWGDLSATKPGHGGEIQLEPGTGGASFRIWLPDAEPEDPANATHGPAERSP